MGNYPVFPILGVFRLKGQPKRDSGIIVRSCKASQSSVYPIRDAILAVNHASCPSLSSSGPPPVGWKRIEPGFPILGVFRLIGQPRRYSGIIIQVLQGQAIVWHDSRVQFSAYFPSLTHCSAVLEGVGRFYSGRWTAVMFVTMKPTRGRRDGHGHRRTVCLHHARRPSTARIGAGPGRRGRPESG